MNEPAARRAPSDAELLRMVEDGLSHAEITLEWERQTGETAYSSTVSGALSRAALTKATGHRYLDCVPWAVRPEHRSAEPARMLRLLGRRRSGFPMSDLDESRLDAWLAMLERERVVVGYSPDPADGFLYVDQQLRSGPNPDIPIRALIIDPSSMDEAAGTGP